MSLSIILMKDEHIVFDTEFTDNLIPMAREAGIYEYLWEPGWENVMTAEQLARNLPGGISGMVCSPNMMESLNPSNGWGSYEEFVPALFELMMACRRYPTAIIKRS